MENEKNGELVVNQKNKTNRPRFVERSIFW